MTKETEINQTVFRRYCSNYGMSNTSAVTENRIRDHWALERRLRDDILQASPDRRWQVTEEAYRRLYDLLSWHDGASKTIAGSEKYDDWTRAVETIGQRLKIFEVGSGQGGLLRWLARHGHDCRGTEITSLRGEKYVAKETSDQITWATTDGVHLDRFEVPGQYDVVISNQVLEHLHPDDLTTHFHSAFEILRKGGAYIFSTPHRTTGPHDLSAVFDLPEAVGLHLREYSWKELADVARSTKFSSCKAATTMRLRSLAPQSEFIAALASTMAGPYLSMSMALETSLACIPGRRFQQKLARSLRRARIFSDNIFMICVK